MLALYRSSGPLPCIMGKSCQTTVSAGCHFLCKFMKPWTRSWMPSCRKDKLSQQEPTYCELWLDKMLCHNMVRWGEAETVFWRLVCESAYAQWEKSCDKCNSGKALVGKPTVCCMRTVNPETLREITQCDPLRHHWKNHESFWVWKRNCSL